MTFTVFFNFSHVFLGGTDDNMSAHTQGPTAAFVLGSLSSLLTLGKLAKTWYCQSAHNDEWMTSRKPRTGLQEGECTWVSFCLWKTLNKFSGTSHPISEPEDTAPHKLLILCESSRKPREEVPTATKKRVFLPPGCPDAERRG